MLEYGKDVIFRCPHRCDTWQKGYIVGTVGKKLLFDVVFPYDGDTYAYPPHTAYVFSEADYGVSYTLYYEYFDRIIGTCTDISKI